MIYPAPSSTLPSTAESPASAMFLDAYAPLADALAPFLDEPSNLHIATTYFYKLLLDIHQEKIRPLIGAPSSPTRQTPAQAAISRLLHLQSHPAISPSVKETLANTDIPALAAYFSHKWQSTAGSPSKVLAYTSPYTNETFAAVQGKVFLLNAALLYLSPLLSANPQHHETLAELISPQPSLPPHRTNYKFQLAASVTQGFFELNKALSRYLRYPYTMDDAPTHRAVGYLPGEVGHDNIFRKANNAAGLLVPIPYPNGAPLAKQPRDDAIVFTLQQFLRVGAAVAKVWTTHVYEALVTRREAKDTPPGLDAYRAAKHRLLSCINEILADPFSATDEVKSHILEINFEGAWAFLWCFVRDVWGREGAGVEARVCEMVVRAATLGSEDPRGIIGRVVERRLGDKEAQVAVLRALGEGGLVFGMEGDGVGDKEDGVLDEAERCFFR